MPASRTRSTEGFGVVLAYALPLTLHSAKSWKANPISRFCWMLRSGNAAPIPCATAVCRSRSVVSGRALIELAPNQSPIVGTLQTVVANMGSDPNWIVGVLLQPPHIPATIGEALPPIAKPLVSIVALTTYAAAGPAA